MILLIRAIKSNSFWILSAEENFVIKEESVSVVCSFRTLLSLRVQRGGIEHDAVLFLIKYRVSLQKSLLLLVKLSVKFSSRLL